MGLLHLIAGVFFLSIWQFVLAVPVLADSSILSIISSATNSTLELGEPFGPSNAQTLPDPNDVRILVDVYPFILRTFSYGKPLAARDYKNVVNEASHDAVVHSLGRHPWRPLENKPNFTYHYNGVQFFMKLDNDYNALTWLEWRIILGGFEDYGKANGYRETQFYLFRGKGYTMETGKFVAYGSIKQIR